MFSDCCYLFFGLPAIVMHDLIAALYWRIELGSMFENECLNFCLVHAYRAASWTNIFSVETKSDMLDCR